MIRALKRSMAVLLVGATGALLCGCGSPSPTPGGSSTQANSSASSSTYNQAQSTAPDASAQSLPSAKASDAASGQGKISLTRNLYFVFDGSGSMRHPPSTGGKSKIEGAKWAVHEFLKAVPDNVNLGLYVFDAKGPRQLLALGANNRTAFLQAIDSVQVGGATPLGAAIHKAADALAAQYKKQLGYGEYRLIVITDGEATDSLAAGVNTAAGAKIPIYTIGFDMDSQHSLRKHSVSYRTADSATEVEKGLEEAAAELDVFDAASFNKGSK